MKIGEFLIKHGHISRDQMEEALKKQEQTPDLLLGEILFSMKAIDNVDLIKSIMKYVLSEGAIPERIHVWISQEEIDELIREFEKHKK